VISLPEEASLEVLLSRFAAALRSHGSESSDAVREMASHVVGDGLAPEARIQVYRNNVHAMFVGALERTYPVLRRRVGDAYFHQLAVEYRAQHPSRSGDLHWVGKQFAPWLRTRLAGTDYAWLADLAELEWACEEALVAEQRPALEKAVLAAIAPECVADVMVGLQPGARFASSTFPIWSVWQANQSDEPGAPVDPATGSQQVVVCCGTDGLVLHSLPADQFAFVSALASGATLSGALESSGLDVERLPGVLSWLFGEGLVTALSMAREDGAS
jgi:hypothetical protein